MRGEESESDTYYFGDPCYVIPDDDWGDFCNIADDTDYGEFEGYRVAIRGTGGDGGWDGWYNGSVEICVDAGIVAIVPIEVCDPQKVKDVCTGPHRHGVLYEGSFPELEVHGWGGADVIEFNGNYFGGDECDCGWSGCSKVASYSNGTDCNMCGSFISGECIVWADHQDYEEVCHRCEEEVESLLEEERNRCEACYETDRSGLSDWEGEQVCGDCYETYEQEAEEEAEQERIEAEEQAAAEAAAAGGTA